MLIVRSYADIHYYFSEPTPRPLHHRFDKASYVYLYRDTSVNRGRLEIANNVGKPEQDAFTGCELLSRPPKTRQISTDANQDLDHVQVTMSHKHPTLCTVTVDAPDTIKITTSPTPQTEERHWRLPSTDPRDEGKFLFRLHTVDIYFWKVDDAHSFIDAIGKILHQEQLRILDAPPVPVAHEAVVSPVVQQLENIAFTDPAYHNGQTRNSRAALTELSIPTVVSIKQPQHDEHKEAPAAAKSPEAYAPLAYNPAAPPAPEPIKHREKTPPPPESESGTGLAAAAYSDHVNAYAPSTSQHQSSFASQAPQLHSPQAYPGPPQQASSRVSVSSSTTFPNSPSPFTQGQRTSSVSTYHPPPPPSAAGKSSPYPQQQMTVFAPPPQNPNAHLYGGGATPMESPATEVIGNSYIDHSKQPLQHLQPQYADYLQSRPTSQEPVGGYSNYQYGQPHHHHSHHSQGDPNDIHSQVYRPTEEEAKNHGGHRKKSSATPGQQPGRIEEKVDRAEKGVNRFLKRLEKKIG